MAIVIEHPPQPGREKIVPVVIGDDRRLVANAEPRHQLGEPGRADNRAFLT
jgi:hypothetical protein